MQGKEYFYLKFSISVCLIPLLFTKHLNVSETLDMLHLVDSEWVYMQTSLLVWFCLCKHFIQVSKSWLKSCPSTPIENQDTVVCKHQIVIFVLVQNKCCSRC